jgi:hypothetical protein
MTMARRDQEQRSGGEWRRESRESGEDAYRRGRREGAQHQDSYRSYDDDRRGRQSGQGYGGERYGSERYGSERHGSERSRSERYGAEFRGGELYGEEGYSRPRYAQGYEDEPRGSEHLGDYTTRRRRDEGDDEGSFGGRYGGRTEGWEGQSQRGGGWRDDGRTSSGGRFRDAGRADGGFADDEGGDGFRRGRYDEQGYPSQSRGRYDDVGGYGSVGGARRGGRGEEWDPASQGRASHSQGAREDTRWSEGGGDETSRYGTRRYGADHYEDEYQTRGTRAGGRFESPSRGEGRRDEGRSRSRSRRDED